MEVMCKFCKSKIKSENINVVKDTAYCSNCENITALSALVSSTASSSFNPAGSESGITVTDQSYSWSIQASHLGPISIFLVPFTAVWAGGSLSGIYGSQLAKGELNLEQSLFGIPFLLGSIVLVTLTLMSLFGRTVVSNENGKALIFIGIGKIGWYRRFEWSSIDRVSESMNIQYKSISLEGGSRLSFGWGLSSKKLYFIANYLRSKLKK
jgi:hypothetical protein